MPAVLGRGHPSGRALAPPPTGNSASFVLCSPAAGSLAEGMEGGGGGAGERGRAKSFGACGGGETRPATCLAAKFTKKAPDSMNFVNFARKKLCFQGRGLSKK